MSSELERTLLPSSEATGAVHEVCVCRCAAFSEGESPMMMYFCLLFMLDGCSRLSVWRNGNVSRFQNATFASKLPHIHIHPAKPAAVFFFRACSGVGERVRNGRVSRLRLTQHRLPQLTTIPIKSRTRESRHDNPHAAATPTTATNQAF